MTGYCHQKEFMARSGKSRNKTRRRDSHRKVHSDVFDDLNSLMSGLLSDPTPVEIQRETLVSDPLDEESTDFQPRQEHRTKILSSVSSKPIEQAQQKNFFEPASQVHPLRNEICEDREKRRRVLFAKGKTGHGRRRPPRFTVKSKEKC